VSVLAAAVGFYGMLAIFPALAVLVAIYGLFADPATVGHSINTIGRLLPAEAQSLIVAFLKSVASYNSSRLGISLLVSFLLALWTARAGTVTVIEALNIIYEEAEKRGTLKFESVALAMTLAGILFAIVALVLVAAIPAAIELLSLSKGWRIIGFALPWPILVAGMVVALATTYRFAPSRETPKWQWVTWGSVFATALWIAASLGFSFYVASFGSYDRTFGSLGAVVVLLTWFYISAFSVLLGACLDAEIERQAALKGTIAAEKSSGLIEIAKGGQYGSESFL
jgi:membrane protein